MLDLFHRWNNDDLTKEIRSMPREQRLIFEYAWTGQNELRLGTILHSDSHHLVNRKDRKGRTPLHYACSMGHFNAVEWLIRNGTNSVNDEV